GGRTGKNPLTSVIRRRQPLGGPSPLPRKLVQRRRSRVKREAPSPHDFLLVISSAPNDNRTANEIWLVCQRGRHRRCDLPLRHVPSFRKSRPHDALLWERF